MRPCIDILSWCTKFVGEVQNEECKVENSHLFLYWEGSLRGSIKSILVNYSTPNALWEECLQSQPDLILISKLVSLECRHRCHPSISILAWSCVSEFWKLPITWAQPCRKAPCLPQYHSRLCNDSHYFAQDENRCGIPGFYWPGSVALHFSWCWATFPTPKEKSAQIFNDGNGGEFFTETVDDHFYLQYFEAADLAVVFYQG